MPAPSLAVRITTRYSDLDPLGHVNNVAYLGWMETARVRYVTELGAGLRGRVLVARAEVDYLREVPATTAEVEVEVVTESVGRSSFVLRHDISDDGVPVATGRVVMVAVDEQRRPRPVSDEERALLLGG